jgi:hypothetical protein
MHGLTPLSTASDLRHVGQSHRRALADDVRACVFRTRAAPTCSGRLWKVTQPRSELKDTPDYCTE